MEGNGLFFLEDIYTRMQEAELVTSKAEFSQRFLGKGASYLTSMRSRQRNVPEDVFAFLTDRLEAGMAESAQWSADYEEKLRVEMARQHCHAELLDAVRKLQGTDELPAFDTDAPIPARSWFARAFSILAKVRQMSSPH